MLSMIIDKAKELFSVAKEFWGTLSRKQKQAVGIGAAMFGGAALVGGAVFQFAMGGIIVNVLLWSILKDMPLAMNFLRKHGSKIDIGITIFGLVSGGGLGAWLTVVMTTGFFTVFRFILAPPYIEGEEPVEVKKTYHAKDGGKVVEAEWSPVC